jgi:hypothetical protein
MHRLRGKSQGIGTNWEAIFLTKEKYASTTIETSAVLKSVDEAAWVSTNDAAQWGLAAIQNLALIGDRLQTQNGG